MATSEQSVVGIYESTDQAEKAVQQLDQGGFPINQISIVGKNLQSEKKINGFLTKDDAAKSAARVGAWTGCIFGLLAGAASLWVPSVGRVIVAGPLAAGIPRSLEGAAAGGASAGLLGMLLGWGISKKHVLEYLRNVKAGEYVLVCYGSAVQVKKANAILKTTKPGELNVHNEPALVGAH